MGEQDLMGAKMYDQKSIETLASAEADAWFVSDVLVASSLRHASFDKDRAIRLLTAAIDELSACPEPSRRWEMLSPDSSNSPLTGQS